MIKKEEEMTHERSIGSDDDNETLNENESSDKEPQCAKKVTAVTKNKTTKSSNNKGKDKDPSKGKGSKKVHCT